MPQSNDQKARRDELIATNVCVVLAVLILGVMVIFTFFVWRRHSGRISLKTGGSSLRHCLARDRRADDASHRSLARALRWAPWTNSTPTCY
jgi:hypothetical protein